MVQMGNYTSTIESLFDWNISSIW